MAGSALLGTPPNTEEDVLIIKGFWRAQGVPYSPDGMSSIIPSGAPPNPPHDSGAAYSTVWPIVIIVLTTIITGARLLLRIFLRDLRWGPDDWAILVGALGVVAFFGLDVAIGLNAGGGRHMWDITYAQFRQFFVVCGRSFYLAR